jgi:tRNA threonylcarbamoyladenosine biosynthesis protein TsaE
MIEKTIIYGHDELQAVAQELCALLPAYSVITLTGSLGAGKTTLMQAIMHELGITEQVTSPTFTYVHTYTGADGKRYHHFDLYRIGSLDAFLASGFDEYLADAHATTFVEWPEVIMPLLQHVPVMHLKLDYEGIEKRRLTIQRPQ